jgi:hypothetical protein
MQMDRMVAYLLLQLSDIKVDMRDVKFWFKKKTFPQLEDSGLVDVHVEGFDSRIFIRWKVETFTYAPARFTVDAVDVNIQKMRLDFKQAHHDWLLSIAAKMFTGHVKRMIEDYIESSLREGLTAINNRLNQIAVEGLTVAVPDIAADVTKSVTSTVKETVIPAAKEQALNAVQAVIEPALSK